MALLEAMACAKAVVATASGATPELVADGQTGRLVAAGDVDGLAEAFLTYAERSDLRRAHGRAARAQVAESFHIVACARKYARCFGVVLDDERGG
jgi:glycosyltransferase involved in cell wall biosynthesis